MMYLRNYSFVLSRVTQKRKKRKKRKCSTLWIYLRGVRQFWRLNYSEIEERLTIKRSNETVTKICMNCTNESLHVTEKKKNDIYIYLYEEYIYNKKKKNDKYVMYLNGMWYMVLHICT